MKRVALIALREFTSTVGTKAFLVGLFIMPAILGALVLVGPRLFNPRVQIAGEVAVVDPTKQVVPELRSTMDARRIAARRQEQARQVLAQAPEAVRQAAGNAGVANAAVAGPIMGAIPDLHLVERPADADIQHEKEWLLAAHDGPRRLALVVIHADAVSPGSGQSRYGSYDVYVPANVDDRAENEIYQSLREAIVNARVQAQALDREKIDAMVRLPRVPSVTVTKERERKTVGAFNVFLPLAFTVLLMIGVMTGGQALLTTTVEEKSSRVIEVLLSAVSPIELLAGKIFGQLAVSLLTMSLYIGMGLITLTSFALFGLLNPWLIVYLIIFFVLAYLVIGSLMVAVGAAVNEMKEAQSLMMPIMLFVMVPWLLWMPISRDPNSTFSTVISFVPPINTFTMLLRMASNAPPPWWQVWLSIGIGVASAVAAVWFAAKIFRIGLLMYGKPPNIATLVRWVRAA